MTVGSMETMIVGWCVFGLVRWCEIGNVDCCRISDGLARCV